MAQKIRAAGKVNLNFAVSPKMAEEFRQAADGHFGKLSLCFESAMAMWLAAHPEEQGRWLKRLYEAGVDEAVDQMLDGIRQEQQVKVAEADGRRPKRPADGRQGSST